MKEFVLSASEGRQLSIDYRAELNDEQYKVVSEGDGPCLVLAGAGSGKTRTVTYRVAWLLEHGVQPEQILLLTFTNKAASEMTRRVEGLLKQYPAGLWAGTFHSIANRILRQYGNRTEYGSGFSILDEEDAHDLMKLCVKDEKVDTAGKRFPNAHVLKSIASYAANARLPLADVIADRSSSFALLTDEIVRVIRRYESEKRRQKAMDFDDLLLELLRLLETDDEVRQALAERFVYVLVDEFQDTNVIQAEIVDKLSSAKRNVLVVGDDAQSIYSFRAAEIRNILDFPKRYQGAQVFRLVVNYRSTPQILAVANAVIAGNTDQFKKELVSACPSGDLPSLVPAADERQEAQYVAEQVLAFLDEGTPLHEMAVLFRAAFHSQALEFELMKRNIPYDYRGGLKFFERAHVKDAVAHLRLLRNVSDSMAWIRALHIHPGFGLTTAAKVAASMAGYQTVGDAMLVTPKLGAKAALGWQRAAKIISAMATADSPAAAIRALAGSHSYKEYLEAEFQNAPDRLEDLEQFALFAEQYDEVGPFLDAVTLAGDFSALTDPERPNRQTDTTDKLVLSTIHQAKGLEWQTVFMIHLADGMFPHSRSQNSESEMAEERRLFYVAATRARRRLFFAYPLTSGFDHVEIRTPSQFLDEIPKGAVETIKLRASLPNWASRRPASTFARSEPASHEPVIVLDNLGERVNRPQAPGSFLRSVDELIE